MAKDKTEQTIARVAALVSAEESPQTNGALAAALMDKSNLVVARAASVIETRQSASLVDALEAAYHRFISKLPDKGCLAKTAIASALYSIGASAESVFLHGVDYVQKEASWGPPVDVAIGLRGTCALGLVRIGHREALARSADLLGDAEAQARIMAARALAYSASEYAALPIRTKLQIGDDDPEVMAECFAALLKLTPAPAVPLIARFLDSKDDDLRQYAALALGESRLASAAEVLMLRWRTDIHPDRREQLALPIATLRSPVSFDFLVNAIVEESASTAAAILEALRIYAHDPAAVKRVRDAVKMKDDSVVTEVFERKFLK